MKMQKINKILAHNPRYGRYKKPLEAAGICEAARGLSRGRFEVVSFNNALLTLSVKNSSEAANLQAESQNLIDELNKKIGKKAVERIRFKIQ